MTEKITLANTGIKRSEESNKKNKDAHLGKVCITNGTINRMVNKVDFVPEGWRYGQTKKKRSVREVT